MTAFELKLAVAIAKDSTIDLSGENFDLMIGFGLRDFTPVHVSLRTVAKCLRWQCQMLNGGWDEHQFNEDRPHYLRNIHVTDLTEPELQRVIVNYCTARLEGRPAVISTVPLHNRLAA